MKDPITTHVLDTSTGRPAEGIPVRLSISTSTGDVPLGDALTDDDGRIVRGLIPWSAFQPGTYRIEFDVAAYFARQGVDSFYPSIQITFAVVAGQSHYHVPLLLSPFGFSTYRGS